MTPRGHKIETAFCLGEELVVSLPPAVCRLKERKGARRASFSAPHLDRRFAVRIRGAGRMVERLARPMHRLGPQRVRGRELNMGERHLRLDPSRQRRRLNNA